jgi:hypothetical protein
MADNTYNHRAIFKKAHFNASWKRAGGDKRQYRVIFADCLRLAYSDARRQAEWRAQAAVLPAYVPPAPRGYYMSRPRYVIAVGA